MVGTANNGTPYCEPALLRVLSEGLPLVPRPYAAIARQTGMSEAQVMSRLAQMRELGLIKRTGVIVRHRELGYIANGMVVWDIPNSRIPALGRCLSRYPFVTLCYRRPRRLPDWPYNLFTMVHGQSREEVVAQVSSMVTECGLKDINHEILFSQRRFKQRGARYIQKPGSDVQPQVEMAAEADERDLNHGAY